MKGYKDLIRTENTIISLANNGTAKPKPLVELNGYPIIYKGTINTIQGKDGSFKSCFAEDIITSMLSANSVGKNQIKSLEDCIVIYFDTERPIESNLPQTYYKIKKLAGIGGASNLHLTSLINEPKTRRRLRLLQYLYNYLRLQPKKHAVIVLDVITDIALSFNDSDLSVEFIDFLNRLITRYNCTIIGVIHENPGFGYGKARGHLGTELVNKATNSFRIAKNKSGIELSAIKHRNTGTLPVFNFTYDSKSGSLVYNQNSVGYSFSVASNYSRSALITFLASNLKTNVSRKNLLSILKKAFGRSGKFLDGELKQLIARKTVISNRNNTKLYLKSKRSSHVVYFLSP